MSHHSLLCLVSVCDASTGVVLFEERFEAWRAGANSKGVGRLVRSFFQIAREIDARSPDLV